MFYPRRLPKALLLALVGLLASLCANPASAGPFDTAESETFANSQPVSDQDLSDMRGGGFIDINGVLIDINFLTRVQVGLDMLQNVNINASDLTNAVSSATQLQDLIQPQIIQNMDNDTLISIQQALSVDIANIQQISTLAQVNQLGLQRTLGM